VGKEWSAQVAASRMASTTAPASVCRRDGDVGGAVERNPALVTGGQVGLVGETGGCARYRGSGREWWPARPPGGQESAGRAKKQVAGGGMLDGAAPRARTSALPVARRAMVACSRARTGLRHDGRRARRWWPRLQLDHVVHIQEDPAETGGQKRTTVLLPEPMKPVRTMRRIGSIGRSSD